MVSICVSDDADPVPRQTGFAKATKTSGAAKGILEAIKFNEKPSCVGVDF